MSTYSARAELEGEYWVIDVEGVGVTQARTLDKVEHMARDLVAIMEEVPYGDVQVKVHVELPDGASAALDEARELAQSAAELQARAAEQMRNVVAGLSRQGMTVREVAAALHVSAARAGQLIASAVQQGNQARVSRSQANKSTVVEITLRPNAARGESPVVRGGGTVIRRATGSGRYVTNPGSAAATTRKSRAPHG